MQTRTLAYILVALFVILKIPHLSYAFYWDESSVYAPAIYHMYANGPSLAPNAIPTDFSRGHPLMFHVACAAWMKLFGKSHIAMHSYALFIAVALAVSVYEALRKIFNPTAGLAGLLILLTNVFFFANSSALLTDIPLGLFTLLSLYAYVRANYVLTAICLTMLIYMKESGLVLPVILAGDIALGVATRRYTMRTAIYRSLSILIAILLLATFFIRQKVLLGWYLYPLHTSLLDLSFTSTMHYLHSSFSVLLFNFSGYAPLGILAVLLTIKAATELCRKSLIIALGVLLFGIGICFWGPEYAIFYITLSIGIAGLLLLLLLPLPNYNPEQTQFVRLAALFCAAFLYFSSVNFFEARYLFPAMLVLILLCAIHISKLQSSLPRKTNAILMAAVLLVGLATFLNSRELDMYDRIDVQQKVVDHLERKQYQSRVIYTRQYLESIHLKDPYTGFITQGKPFQFVSDSLSAATELCIFDNIEYGDKNYEIVNSDSTFKLEYRVERNGVWAEVYKRREMLHASVPNTYKHLATSDKRRNL